MVMRHPVSKYDRVKNSYSVIIDSNGNLVAPVGARTCGREIYKEIYTDYVCANTYNHGDFDDEEHVMILEGALNKTFEIVVANEDAIVYAYGSLNGTDWFPLDSGEQDAAVGVTLFSSDLYYPYMAFKVKNKVADDVATVTIRGAAI